MIIRDNTTTAVSQLYTRQLQATTPSERKPAPARGAPPERDNVEISPEAQALQKAARPDDMEEVRWDRVTQLRQQIEQGSYEIPFNDLAQRLLGEA